MGKARGPCRPDYLDMDPEGRYMAPCEGRGLHERPNHCEFVPRPRNQVGTSVSCLSLALHRSALSSEYVSKAFYFDSDAFKPKGNHFPWAAIDDDLCCGHGRHLSLVELAASVLSHFNKLG